MSRKFHLRALIAGAIVLVCVAMAWALWQDGRRKGEDRDVSLRKIPFGILGDSDSAAYQDHVLFPPGTVQPGGPFRSIALQWPEVLAKVRATQVDLGPWAIWGVSPQLSMARIRDSVDLPWRGPQRETHQHNLAWASGCDALNKGAWRQTARLVDVMNEHPNWWSNGVVVIRTGVNDFGKEQDLDALAKNPESPSVLRQMEKCVHEIDVAVHFIHRWHPKTRIVLVGIFNNAHWGPYQSKWASAQEQKNLDRGLDHFDNALKSMVSQDSRLAFFDDRAWFARHWGHRHPESGRADYRVVHVGSLLDVGNSVGDRMDHATLGNLHAGLVWNVLWTQSLIDLLDERYGMPISKISEQDVESFVRLRMDVLRQKDEAGSKNETNG